MDKQKIFSETKDAAITKAIFEAYFNNLKEIVESDVIVVGAGPSGLMAAKDLARAHKKVVLIENNNYLGGGFWIGGFFLNKITLRSPSQSLISELNVPLTEHSKGVYVGSAPHACSALIKSCMDAGVNVLNMTCFEDVVVRDNKVCGAVINWSAIKYLPKNITCLDPVAIESMVVVDATGHEACVVRSLAKRNLVEIKGEQPMNANSAEDSIVEFTRRVYPGLYVSGMACAQVFGLNRMGPTFGAMLYSGKKVAELILSKEF